MKAETLYRLFDVLFRRARNKRLIETMQLAPETTVLDVGGTPRFWEKMPVKPRVTLLNKTKFENCPLPQITGDACHLPFPDQSFDIVFSNSMIEHLETWGNQVLAASEMMRVGKRLWVQTPDRYFPVDPHLLTPFYHWLPKKWQYRLLPYTVIGMIRKLRVEDAPEKLREYRLLDAGEVKTLYPGCEILKERALGMVKSIIAVRTE